MTLTLHNPINNWWTKYQQKFPFWLCKWYTKWLRITHYLTFKLLWTQQTRTETCASFLKCAWQIKTICILNCIKISNMSRWNPSLKSNQCLWPPYTMQFSAKICRLRVTQISRLSLPSTPPDCKSGQTLCSAFQA